jgi:hypothetical protein
MNRTPMHWKQPDAGGLAPGHPALKLLVLRRERAERGGDTA